MIKYCLILDEQTGLVQLGAGCDDEFYKSIGMKQRDVEQSEIDNLYYLKNKCPHYTPEEEEEIERQRILNLKCTKRVFVLMLEQLGFDYFEQIEPLINANRQAKLEWVLCVELERKNPLLNIMGEQLGITPEQIDKLFKYANGEITEGEFLNGN